MAEASGLPQLNEEPEWPREITSRHLLGYLDHPSPAFDGLASGHYSTPLNPGRSGQRGVWRAGPGRPGGGTPPAAHHTLEPTARPPR
ncbi:MAG: hypothetical protein NVSMB32_16050 [Actinomycetota bacterium]